MSHNLRSHDRCFRIVSWNVRGLGDSDKCRIVRELFSDAKPNIVCIQESKLVDFSLSKAKTFLPRHLSSSLASVNIVGTCGGLITAWDPALFTLTAHSSNQFCLSTSLSCNASNYDFTVTNVYGPSDHSLTAQFLQCLRVTRMAIQGAWVLLGDFNLIRQPADKSNGIINSALADAFNQTIDELAITEVNLSDRRFTWTNKQFFQFLQNWTKFLPIFPSISSSRWRV